MSKKGRKKGKKKRKEDSFVQSNEGEMYQAQIFTKYEGSSSHARHPGPDSDHLCLIYTWVSSWKVK